MMQIKRLEPLILILHMHAPTDGAISGGSDWLSWVGMSDLLGCLYDMQKWSHQ